MMYWLYQASLILALFCAIALYLIALLGIVVVSLEPVYRTRDDLFTIGLALVYGTFLLGVFAFAFGHP